MNEGRLILIVDDDPHIREVVGFALRGAGYRTAEAGDGGAALALFEEMTPDLIVLDIMMPDIDGIEVCRSIRGRSNVPIVFLSSRDEEIDRIVGLELGGDDYLTKPFSPRELVARVKAVLRRGTFQENAPVRPPQTIVHGLLKIDMEGFRAFWSNREVALTVTEFGILRTLLRHPGKVFTRDELMSNSYTYDNIVTERTIDSHVRRVRRKFADVSGDPIETVHGVGYRIGECRQQ